ncbi:MAG: RMD1 family protein [Rhodospirillales bacterium]
MSNPISQSDLQQWRRIPVRAVLVAKRIDLRPLYRTDSLATAPLALSSGADGVAVLFRYGVAVMFRMNAVEQAAFLKSLASVCEDPLEETESEDAEIVVDATAEERVGATGIIHLRAVSMERLLLVADVLAKSVALAFDERRAGLVFDRVEPVAERLRSAGGRRLSARELLAHIGDVLMTQHRMVGRVEVTEKPELLWDRPELERLYLRLQEEYELPERDRALSRKLALIRETATTALGLLQARRSHRVEWYIVILIVIEIVLSLYEMAHVHT